MTTAAKKRRPKGHGALYTIHRKAWNEHTQSFVDTTLYQAAQDITHPLKPGIRKRITGSGHTPQQAKERLEKSKMRFYIKLGTIQYGPLPARGHQKIPTLTEFFEEWYENLPPDRVSSSKRLKYRGIFRNHILPEFGKRNLHDIDFSMLDTFIHKTLPNKQKLIEGKPTGERLLSTNSILNIYWAFNNLLTTAHNRGLIHRNPLKLVPAPKFQAPRENIPHFMHVVEEMFTQMKEEGDPAYERFFLGLLGLRRGERLGLSWSNVRLTGSNPTMVISQTLIREPGMGLTIKPSTKNGKDRVVPLSGPFLELMIQLKKKRAEQQSDPDFTPSELFGDLVFLTDKGRPIDPNTDNDLWRATLKKYSVDLPIRQHALRHVSATYLADLNVGTEVAQEILGHESQSLSYYYARKTGKRSRKDIEAYGKVLEEAMQKRSKKTPS